MSLPPDATDPQPPQPAPESATPAPAGPSWPPAPDAATAAAPPPATDAALPAPGLTSAAEATPPALDTTPPALGPPAPPPPPPSLLARFRSWRFARLVELLVTVGIALGLAESVQAAVVKPFVIPTQSMEPTLMPGQRVLVNRLAYDFGSPSRGDIVVFHPPAQLTCAVIVALSEPCPQSHTKVSSQYFVKRVVALPGDRLSIRRGHPVVNGKELTHEPYITACGGAESCNMPHTITVPRGEYYVLGDNRGDSDDSRYWGPVRSSWIIGEVFATYWPPDRIGVF